MCGNEQQVYDMASFIKFIPIRSELNGHYLIGEDFEHIHLILNLLKPYKVINIDDIEECWYFYNNNAYLRYVNEHNQILIKEMILHK